MWNSLCLVFMVSHNRARLGSTNDGVEMLPLIALREDKLTRALSQLRLGKGAEGAKERAFNPHSQSIDARIDDTGEWLVMPLLTNELPFVTQADRTSQRWRVVLKLHHGSYTPWVLVGPSAFLAEAGLNEDGLYAMRNFRGKRSRGVTDTEGDRIGSYSGEILAGPFADPDSPEADREGAEAAQRGKDALLWVKRTGGWFLVDGSQGGAPFLHKMNDARGPRNNVRFLPSGAALATKRVPAADLTAARAISHLAPAELLVGYGPSFWRLHQHLGSREAPLVVDAPW